MHGARAGFGRLVLAASLFIAALVSPAAGGPVAVRYQEGVTHGFLTLRSTAGELLADGDLLQVVRGERVESRLVFRFRDGSVYDETAVYSQNKVFTLLSYRLQQRGPSFPDEMQISLERERDRGRYQVTSRRAGDEAETVSGETELPPDAYNGMMTMLLKNLPKGAGETVHVLAFTPKPTLVKLEMTPLEAEPVPAGERRVPATHYVLKPKLGLLRGAAAALLGKTPADYHCWIIPAELPAFVGIDGPLYTGGPIWRIETVSPRLPARPAARR
jgi:hypothetical protein